MCGSAWSKFCDINVSLIMKKRKIIHRQIHILTGATTITNESGLFQYYNGDFFTIFVTQPVNLQLHHHLKKSYGRPGQLVHLRYMDEFIFEIVIDRTVIADYQTIFSLLTSVDDLA